MYASVVSELKTKISTGDSETMEPSPARAIYDDVEEDSFPVVPPRQIPPVPKPRLVPIRPAPLPPQRNTEKMKTAKPSAPNKTTPDLKSEEPVSLPAWSWVPEVHTPESSSAPSQSNDTGTTQTESTCRTSPIPDNEETTSPTATGIEAVTKQLAGMFVGAKNSPCVSAPQPGWAVPPVTPARRYSADESLPQTLPAEPDEVAPGCGPIGFGGIFGAARKRTSLAVQAVKKKLEPSPKPARRPVERTETRYAVSSDLLRELAEAESAPSNGRYIVGKELLSELLEAAAKPPPPSAPPLNLIAS